MPTRHGDCGLALNLAPDSSTNHESDCGIEKGRGWGSRQYKLPRKKSKRSKKGIADKVSYRLCREPVHRAAGCEQSALNVAESFELTWSCKLGKTYRTLAGNQPWIRLQTACRLQDGQGMTPQVQTDKKPDKSPK